MFEDVYKKYFSLVYKFILKLSKNETLAEDITSETFFKALKNINKFDGKSSISTWLCQIAKNTYYSYLKSNSKITNLGDLKLLNVIDEKQNIEDAIMKENSSYEAKKHLHNIPEPYKEVFMWRFFGEMGYKEIGNLYGKSENWACVTYYRARELLKEKMEDYHE